MYQKCAVVALSMLFLAAVVTAQDKPACCKKKAAAKSQCQQQAKAKDCCSKKGDKDKCGKSDKCGDVSCTGEQVAYKGVKIPRLAYLVGDQRVGCPKTAAKLAKENDTTLKYVVGDQVFAEKPAALEAHAKQLEKFLAELLTVKYSVGGQCVGCPRAAEEIAKQSGAKLKYQVASFVFDDEQAATQAATKAREAAAALGVDETGDVQKQYKVGKLVTTSKTVAMHQLAIERIKTALDTLAACGGRQVANAGAGCDGDKKGCDKKGCDRAAVKKCSAGKKKCGTGAKKP